MKFRVLSFTILSFLLPTISFSVNSFVSIQNQSGTNEENFLDLDQALEDGIKLAYELTNPYDEEIETITNVISDALNYDKASQKIIDKKKLLEPKEINKYSYSNCSPNSETFLIEERATTVKNTTEYHTEWGINSTTNIKLSYKEIFEVNQTLEVNWKKIESKVVEESTAVVMPSQKFIIEPYTKTEIIVAISQSKLNNTYELKTILKGNVTATFEFVNGKKNTWTTSIGNIAFALAQHDDSEQYKGLVPNSKNKQQAVFEGRITSKQSIDSSEFTFERKDIKL
ncbi:MAG: hypothetical protein REH79_02720 [Spiroplasma sp.]|nr:hypothetical protein [Spiroplasma sp.]